MVAGGGASVIYADTIVDMGGVNELANYGKSIYCLRAQYSKMKDGLILPMSWIHLRYVVLFLIR